MGRPTSHRRQMTGRVVVRGSTVRRPYRRREDTSLAVRRSGAPPQWADPEEDERAGIFRESLSVAGHRFDLVARQPVGGSWTAWIERASMAAGTRTIAPLAASVGGTTASGASAGEALTALADKLRAVVLEAMRGAEGG